MKINSKIVDIDILVIYGLSVCIVVFVSITHIIGLDKKAIKKVTSNPQVMSSELSYATSSFDDVRITGKSYVVYDVINKKVIAGKNENEVLPLASITKVMTAVSAILHKDRNTKITISQKNIEDGYDLGLKNKQEWKLSELLKYTLVFSSNDGALAIADSFGSKDFFITQMNDDAKVLGLQLVFTDPAGRDMNGKIGGIGTALETAKLFSIARKLIPEILDATTKKRETVITYSGLLGGIPNTNQTIETLSGAEASKTGYTDRAGGNLGVIVDISVGHPIVIVVLGSTRQGRFQDIDVLYKALRASVVTSRVEK